MENILTMKITIFLTLSLFIFNACQGRNMPLGHKPIDEISDKKPLVALLEPKVMPKKYTSKKSKEVNKKSVLKSPSRRASIRKKIPAHKKSTKSHHASTKTLAPLPVLPSIEEIQKETTQKIHNKQVVGSQSKKSLALSPIDENVASSLMKKIALPKESFSGGGMFNGLDMGTIRIGKSPDYTSIILDSYIYEGKDVLSSKKSPVSGTYLFTYEPSKHRIIGIIDGYKSFTALQSNQEKLFSDSKVVKNISILKHIGNDGIKFIIALKKRVKVNIFDVKNPGRIIINLFPL